MLPRVFVKPSERGVPTPPSMCMLKQAAVLLSGLAILGIQGCATTPRKSSDASYVVEGRGRARMSQVSVPPQALEVPPVAAQTEADLSLPNAVALQLRDRFVVHQPREDTLVVKPREARQPGSLFEEAIALNVIRGRLKSRRTLPRDVAPRVGISEGTVTIPFGSALAPDAASAAICDVLSVTNVQRVRASFAPDAPNE